MDYDLEGRALYPLHELVSYDQFALATFLPPESARAVFDRLAYTESWNSWDGYDERITAIVVPYEELTLRVPGWDGLRLVVGAPSMPTPIFAEFVVGPGFHTALQDITAHVRFDPHLLRDAATDHPAHFDVHTDIEAYPSKGLAIVGTCLRANEMNPCLAPAYLSDTAVIVAALEVRFAMGPSPDVGLADVPDGFQGLVFDQLDARLPKGTHVTLENCYVGTPAVENDRLDERAVERRDRLIIDREGALLFKKGFRRTPLGLHCAGFADASDPEHARPR